MATENTPRLTCECDRFCCGSISRPIQRFTTRKLYAWSTEDCRACPQTSTYRTPMPNWNGITERSPDSSNSVGILKRPVSLARCTTFDSRLDAGAIKPQPLHHGHVARRLSRHPLPRSEHRQRRGLRILSWPDAVFVRLVVVLRFIGLLPSDRPRCLPFAANDKQGRGKTCNLVSDNLAFDEFFSHWYTERHGPKSREDGRRCSCGHFGSH